MNKQEIRKHRKALTLSVIGYIFAIIIVSLVFTYIGVSVLINVNKIPTGTDGHPDAQAVLLFMTVVNICSGLIVTSVTSHILLKNINEFINQMNRLANGDFKARLNYTGLIGMHPTTREIADSFNKMAEELDNTTMLRGDFINNFSHEFKTPIVSVAGFAKLLKKGNLTQRQTAEYLDIIETESLRLSAMATNVLEMTKIENQRILTDITKYNLSEQIRSCVLLLENAWLEKNIEFSLEFDEYNIYANEELLKRVWINLIHNAIKFSPEYGLIVVKISDLGGHYNILVSNSGEDIPKEKRRKIFEKFYQADESHSSEGNGIGLAIVKKAVELHYGTVSVSSENGITTFTVKLPKNIR